MKYNDDKARCKNAVFVEKLHAPLRCRRRAQALRETAAALLAEHLPRVGPSALPPNKERTMELVKARSLLGFPTPA